MKDDKFQSFVDETQQSITELRDAIADIESRLDACVHLEQLHGLQQQLNELRRIHEQR